MLKTRRKWTRDYKSSLNVAILAYRIENRVSLISNQASVGLEHKVTVIHGTMEVNIENNASGAAENNVKEENSDLSV